MQVIFSPKAFRQLAKLDRNIQKRITEKIAFFASGKNPLTFAERLSDTRFGEWRFRIGEYRVIFDIEKGQMHILEIGNRKEIYR
jgi:mRNA interferase RelE/StbE